MKLRLLLAAALLAPQPLLAQKAGDVEKARQLAAEGAAAFRDKNFELAVEKFREANRLLPHPNLDVNIGRAYEAMGQPDQGLVHCKIALNAPGVPEDTRLAAQQCVDRVTAALARPTLEIESRPPGATVRIDGRLVGQTPWRGNIEPGRRQVDLELDDHAPLSRTINAERGQTYPLSVTLNPAQVGGLLTVTSVPEGATVTLDRELIGNTPIQSFQVDARSYLLEVTRPGYAPYVSTITVGDGKHLERVVTLVATDGPEVASRRPQWPAWALMGAGAVAVGLGGWFGSEALGDRQDADKLARTSTDPDDRPRYDELTRSMETNRTTADVLFITGGTAIVGGLTWLLWPN